MTITVNFNGGNKAGFTLTYTSATAQGASGTATFTTKSKAGTSGTLAALSPQPKVTVTAGSATKVVVTLPGETFTSGSGNSGTVTAQTAGTSFNIAKLTAVDDNNNIVASYSGSKTITYSGPANSPSGSAPTYTTAVSFTSGQSTTTLATTLKDAQSTSITATDGSLAGVASSSLTVNAATANHLAFSTVPPGPFTKRLSPLSLW